MEEIRNIPTKGTILFAVSGGPDSVALVEICAENSQLKKRMHIAYVHHGLRKNADKELEFVRNIAKNLDVPFHWKKIKVKKTKDMSLEEVARAKRYEALIDIAKKTKSCAIMTAHTLDDQVETVLLNLIRGSGLKGLCGMRVVSKIDENLLLIRPFLSVEKKQILDFLEEKEIKYMFDESNLEIKFTRNFIRQKIMPLLEQINPQVRKNIFRTAKILSDDFDFINSEAEKIMKEIVSGNGMMVEFPGEKFRSLHICLQRYLIRRLLVEFCNLVHPPDFETVEKVRTSIISGKKTNIDKLKLSIISTKKNTVRFLKKENFEKFFAGNFFEIKVPGTTKISGLEWKIFATYKKFSKEFLINDNRFIAYINPEIIKDRLILKKPEDRASFVPLGMGKKVSFKKYWKTHKKQIEEFIEFPIVIEDNGAIVWVVGGHISQDYAITDKTRVLEIVFCKA
ncbi:MAG: tRNA lysidine(34) synthetase TilS [Candidatus Omnitrophica bacterium]|nr:tRNA lysidine(34) synthetase TilS [Candidatus Omnitrophota bacterium]